MTFQQYAVLALALAAALAWAVLWLRRHPVKPCPRCGGVGWLPRSSDGSWKRGARPCRRCDRFGQVTVGVVWLAGLLTGRTGPHPLARLERLPMPDRAGRQEVTPL